jgi:hypothetical protein
LNLHAKDLLAWDEISSYCELNKNETMRL